MKVMSKTVIIDPETFQPKCRIVFDTTIEVAEDGAQVSDTALLDFVKELMDQVKNHPFDRGINSAS